MPMVKRIVISVILFFLPVFMFWSCDSIPGDVVESSEYNESVLSIEYPSFVMWSAEDSSFAVSISLQDDSNIESIYLQIINVSGQNELGSSFQLLDNGDLENGDVDANDKIYSSKPYMNSGMANGTYYLRIFKTSRGTGTQNIATVSFEYDNNQRNFPPVISDLEMPAIIRRGNDFVISLKVSDPNGYINIQSVLFKLTRPDGTISMNENSEYFPMFDNGNTELSGDEVGGDGIFTLKNSFSSTAQRGIWTFEFKAIDKAGEESNIIIQNMRVD